MTRSVREAHSASTSFIALGCVGFIASAVVSAVAFAQDAPAAATASADEGKAQRLKGVVVTDTAIEDGPKVEKVASPKATAALLDTPQTITVISNQTIRQQNLLTLRDALSTLPGITFGAGEGGGGFGDSINLRGSPANGDITQDGVRDSAQYSRTDPFDLQQIEIYNGANSVFNGSGSVGGTINLVSKTPQADDLTVLSAGIGTDNYYRATVDTNQRVSDIVAVRLNAMFHRNDVPGRDVEKMKRWGVAPAITIGIDSPTRLTLDYFHQEDDNTPQYGVPYFYLGGGVPTGVDRQAYYGYRNIDKQRINVDRLTATFVHEFSDKVSIRNLTRFQDVQQTTIASQPQGTFCLSTGLTPTGGTCRSATAAATVTNGITTAPAAVAIDIPAGYFLPSGRGVYRDTRNQLAYDQLDLTANFNTAGVEHTLVLGASALWEKFTLNNGSVLRNANGSNPFDAASAQRHQGFISIADPGSVVVGTDPRFLPSEYGSNFYTGPFNITRTGHTDGEQTNYAIYAFDTLKLSKQLELNAGLRYEKVDGFSRVDTIAIPAAGGAGTFIVGPRADNKETLFSFRFGAVFKPVENASIYVAYGNSKTPSKATVNGACTVTGTAQNCNVKPEKARNYEAGIKWDALAGVQLTAAIFRNERNGFRVTSNEPGVTDQVLDGKSRVDGVALGASGRITPEWAIFANYTYLDSKISQGVSDFCLANPSTACANTAAIPDPLGGNQLVNTPKHSGSLFTTYNFPFGLQLGYGLTYQGSFLINNNALPVNLVGGTAFPKSDDWVTQRLFVSYEVREGLTAQLNIQNLTNEHYYTRYRNSANGWATPGEGRSAVLSLFYSF